MSTKVVIIDDDKIVIKHYVQALSAADFKPILISHTSGLTRIINGHEHQDASFFIVDVMMPPGARYKKEQTSGGELTGLFVSRDLRKRFPGTPIILWTGATIDRVLKEAEKHAINTNNCYYAKKLELSPSELVSELMFHLKTGKFRPRIRRLLLKTLRASVEILRLGADIKTITG